MAALNALRHVAIADGRVRLIASTRRGHALLGTDFLGYAGEFGGRGFLGRRLLGSTLNFLSDVLLQSFS